MNPKVRLTVDSLLSTVVYPPPREESADNWLCALLLAALIFGGYVLIWIAIVLWMGRKK